MTKWYYIWLFAIVLTWAAPVRAEVTSSELNAIEQAEEEQIEIRVDQSAVRVTGAQGKVLEVISLTGRHVMSVRIESPAQRIELNIPKGCYIIKIGKVVRKIVV